MPLRILIVHTEYTQSGGEDTVVNQEAELLEGSHEVKVLLYKNKKGLKGLWQFLISVWNVKSARLLKDEINRFKPDLVHVHNWHFASGPIIFRVAKKLQIPIIHTLHNYRLICPSGILLQNNTVFLSSIQQKFPWSAIFKKVYKNSMLLTFWLSFVVWFHRIIGTWNMIDQFVCLTPSGIDIFKGSWMKKFHSKFVSKPNFTNSLISKKQHTEEREPYYLFIGRLSEEKGIRLLIEAFKTLPYKLKIAGKGPLKDFVSQETSKAINISYLGVLDNDGVNQHLQKCEALIFPSIWHETFGLVITEAFSNYCCVISTNIGAPKSIIKDGENGFFFNFNDKRSLINTVQKWETLLPTQKKLMRQNAYKSFIKYYAPETQDLYFDTIFKKVL